MKSKLKVKTPLVEIDGDEMTRIMWQLIREKMILPFLDIDLKYFDLHLSNRDKTDDKVTFESAEAIKKYGVGVKCATITPDEGRMSEYKLKKKWKSPNGTIRAILDGTVFRTPIMVDGISPNVTSWKRPIIIGRHAYGDLYKGQEIKVKEAGRAFLTLKGKDGKIIEELLIHDFEGPGIIQGIYNTDESIRHFAKACFTYAVDQKIDLWFSTKDTISKIYDARFKDIFQEEYDKNYKTEFKKLGISYFFTLIDDAVARIMKGEGGILWALKNYDGDVMSDMVASAFGSLALMTSVLVSPEGHFEYEAAHGTVQRHYYKHLKGEETSSNSMALIFAWSGALRKRGELDQTPEIVDFANKLEEASLETIASGIMTGDMARLSTLKNVKTVSTTAFIEAISKTLEKKMN